MAQEKYPEAQRQLFGPGFEQRLRARSETADTIAKVSIPGRGKQVFWGGTAFRGAQSFRGGRFPTLSAPQF